MLNMEQAAELGRKLISQGSEEVLQIVANWIEWTQGEGVHPDPEDLIDDLQRQGYYLPEHNLED